MSKEEKPSGKSEKRYTRKQIYDDPEVAKHVLENQDDYSEDDVNLAKVTFRWSIHQLGAEVGMWESMPREDFTQQTVANLDAAHAEEVKRIKKRTQ
jgi:hypothetical protein